MKLVLLNIIDQNNYEINGFREDMV